MGCKVKSATSQTSCGGVQDHYLSLSSQTNFFLGPITLFPGFSSSSSSEPFLSPSSDCCLQDTHRLREYVSLIPNFTRVEKDDLLTLQPWPCSPCCIWQSALASHYTLRASVSTVASACDHPEAQSRGVGVRGRRRGRQRNTNEK